jgi:hypothetical protein
MVKRESGTPDRFKGHPRSPAKFRERELARALRAANRAGGIARIELMPDGSIHLIPAGQTPTAQAGDDLDKWMAKKDARQA